MGFEAAIRSGFQNYANFNGRAMRSEYWYWVLFAFLLGLFASIVDTILGTPNLISSIISLALLLPGLAVGARRLHDINRTGWWLLISLTFIGLILLIYFFVQPSQPIANQYGPAPTGASTVEDPPYPQF